MVDAETKNIERKVISFLKIISESKEPVGARLISQRIKDIGIDLSERTIRYHLKLMDERGLTELIGRDGRLITDQGRRELEEALVEDKVGLAITRIEQLAFRTEFDLRKGTGIVPVNVSLFPQKQFDKALQIMRPAFNAGLCVSERVGVAQEGQILGDIPVPKGCIGMATVCSVVINGCMLKAGIPMDSRFGGILQMKHNQPVRFVELIHYSGSSLDPSEVFIRARMTDVGSVVKNKEGKLLANFRLIPSLCRSIADDVISRLGKAGIRGLVVMGNINEPLCGIPGELNRTGMILLGGLNPVAAAVESGIEVRNFAMGTVMEYDDLIKI
jgi:HTH-type transcriptional regulator, global nitrogen regulator NrpRI